MSDSIRLLFHKAGYLVENVSGKTLPVYGPGKNNLWDNAKSSEEMSISSLLFLQFHQK